MQILRGYVKFDVKVRPQDGFAPAYSKSPFLLHDFFSGPTVENVIDEPDLALGLPILTSNFEILTNY